jgi:hypothetical protein
MEKIRRACYHGDISSANPVPSPWVSSYGDLTMDKEASLFNEAAEPQGSFPLTFGPSFSRALCREDRADGRFH